MNKQLTRKLMRLRKRGYLSNSFWFSSFVVKFLNVSPYPVNMYLFEKAFESNPELKEKWLARSHLYDELAEKLQNELGMNDFNDEKSRRFIDDGNTPVHKLNWRQDLGSIKPNSNLQYLIESIRAR